jgi:hypothetical protein
MWRGVKPCMQGFVTRGHLGIRKGEILEVQGRYPRKPHRTRPAAHPPHIVGHGPRLSVQGQRKASAPGTEPIAPGPQPIQAKGTPQRVPPLVLGLVAASWESPPHFSTNGKPGTRIKSCASRPNLHESQPTKPIGSVALCLRALRGARCGSSARRDLRGGGEQPEPLYH